MFCLEQDLIPRGRTQMLAVTGGVSELTPQLLRAFLMSPG